MPEIRKTATGAYTVTLTAGEFCIMMAAYGSAPADHATRSDLYDALWEAKREADQGTQSMSDARERYIDRHGDTWERIDKDHLRLVAMKHLTVLPNGSTPIRETNIRRLYGPLTPESEAKP